METNARKKTIEAAVKAVSEKYNGNLVFDRKPEPRSYGRYRFTVKTLDKLSPPSKISAGKTRRPLYKASWHAWGEIRDEIFRLDAGRVTKKNRTKLDPSDKQPLYVKTALANPFRKDGKFYPGDPWIDVPVNMEGYERLLYSQTSIKRQMTL